MLKINKKIILIVMLMMLFTCINVYAGDGGIEENVVLIETDENQVQWLTFYTPGTPSNATYEHWTEGWNINVHFGVCSWYKNGFIYDYALHDSEEGGQVKIKLEDVLNEAFGMSMEHEYYRNDGTIFIDRRGALKVNGVPTYAYDFLEVGSSPKYTDGSPFFTTDQGYHRWYTNLESETGGGSILRNKDGYGMLDGINHEFGINWTASTQNDLTYYYGLSFPFSSIYQWDRVEVVYETRSGTNLGSKPPNVNKGYNYVTETASDFNGYICNAYKIDVTDIDNNKTVFKSETAGNSASVYLEKDSKLYTITFIYDEVPEGEIYTSLQLEIDPSAILEGTTENIEVTANASNSDCSAGGELAFRYWIDTDPSYSNAGAGVNPKNDEGDITPEIWETTLSNLSPNTVIYGKVKVYSYELNDYAMYETTTIVGEIPATVEAYLEVNAPSIVEWTPNEWNNDTTKSVKVTLNATKSFASAGIDKFSYKVNGSSEGSDTDGVKSVYVDIKPSDKTILGNINILGEVEVEDILGNVDTALAAAYITPTISNTAPEVSFTNDSPHYVTLPVNIVNTTYDKEDDEKYATWTIEDMDGDLLYFSQLEYDVGIFNTDRSTVYFESSGELGQAGGQLYFKIDGHYKVKLEVVDEKGNTGSYEKVIYINTTPQPPTADFDMYEFGFPNETITITDTSTDPNNDITTWDWAKPIEATGSLLNSGGNIAFASEGTYDVTLKVTDYTSLSDQVTKQIKIIPPMAVARITVEGTLKENRKVTIHSRDSLSPRTDPIDTTRNIWTITPLDGQDPTSIKIDTDTSNDEEKNIIFKESGQYKIYLEVFNQFKDDNPTHEFYSATYIEEIITIAPDEIPIADLNVSNITPNFTDNPIDIDVNIASTSYSPDSDYIDKYNWVITRDNNENGNFADDSIYGTYDTSNFNLTVTFEQDNQGEFKAELKVKEAFGQETIENLVTADDRKENSIVKTFSVNWIPDITFDLPEFAYTDDTTSFTTTLKDENINSLNVVWSLKKANPIDTSIMETVDIDLLTEKTLDNDGGNIKILESGYYELIATITDEKGNSSTYSDNIRIYPLPTAVISDDETYRWQGNTFTAKQNRKYILHGNDSFAYDYYSAELHPIDHSKDYFEIIPLDNQGLSSIKVQDGLGGALGSMGSISKLIQANNNFDEIMLLKEPGQYKIIYRVTNTYGKSGTAEQIVTVEEDEIPTAQFNLLETTYRNAAKNASLIPSNLTASSNDLDIIDIQRIRYKFDSDNDGLFDDETWSSDLTIDYINKKATVQVNHVGKYYFEYLVQEEFGQETLNEFVTEADKKQAYAYKIIEVDNIAPVVSFEVIPTNFVDVIIAIGDVDNTKILNIEDKIQTYIKTQLEADTTKYIDVQTQTIYYQDDKSLVDVLREEITFRENSKKYIIDITDSANFLNETRVAQNFEYTGSVQDFTAPFDGTYTLEVWGARGGEDLQAKGGRGGYSKGDIYLNQVDELYVYVGGAGAFKQGGWNGGGNGTVTNIYGNLSTNNRGAAGGGATDIRLYSKDVNERIIVAGGGGGGHRKFYEVFLVRYIPTDTLYSFPIGFFGGPYNSGDGGGLTSNSGGYDVLNILNGTSIRPSMISETPNPPSLVSESMRISYGLEIGEGKNGGKYSAGGGGGYLGGDISTYYHKGSNLTKGDYYLRGASGGTGYIGGVTNGVSIPGNLEMPSPDGGTEIGHYDDGYAKIYLPVSTESTNNALAFLVEDDITFIGLGVSTNKTELENFIKGNDDKGKYIDNTNMNTALNSAGVYMLSTITSNAEDSELYILLDEQVNYNSVYNDFEDDEKMDIEQWKYTHNHTYFNNSLGIASYNNTWLNDSINIFNKVGKYSVEYQTKDNPVDSNDNFDEYRKWSETSQNMNIYVHRKPLADFTVDLTMNYQTLLNPNEFIYSYSVGRYDGSSRWYYWRPSYIGGEGELIKTVKFKTPYVRDDYWINSLRVEGYKNETWLLIESFDIDKDRDYFVRTYNLEGLGYSGIKCSATAYDKGGSVSFSDNGDYFEVVYQKTYQAPVSFNLNLGNISYDLDHSLSADKGITNEEWSYKKESEAIWHSGKLTNGEANEKYLVRLRVLDLEGVWSDYKTAIVQTTPSPPVAQFMLSDPYIYEGNTMQITDTSYDPNGNIINVWEWKLYKNSTLINTYTNQDSQAQINSDINTNGIGEYTLTLQVSDDSGVWGDSLATSEIYSKTFNVYPVNHEPTVNFNLVTNESPLWTFPKTIGSLPTSLNTLLFRPTSTLFYEELARFDLTVNDPDIDNTGFTYDWRLERYNVENISNISGSPDNIYTYTTTSPFTDSFKNKNLEPGAYKITLSVTDKPPVPPYLSGDELMATITKNYFIVPEIELTPSYQANAEIQPGDTIKVSAVTNKYVNNVTCTLDTNTFSLTKISEDSKNIYWEEDYSIPSTIAGGTYDLKYSASTRYGGNGSLTRRLEKELSITISSLKLIDFRVTDIINHDTVTFPYTKDMLISNLINYKTGYYVTFQINSKGEPNSVIADIDIFDNNSVDETINMTKIGTSGSEEIWEGKFYTNARVIEGTVISIELEAQKGANNYNYNTEESWNGRTLIINGSALEDARINLTN